jgi:hypothetical protein
LRLAINTLRLVISTVHAAARRAISETAAEMNPSHPGKLGIARKRTDAWLGRQEREGLLQFFCDRIWSGRTVSFPPSRNALNI